jgi:hypothetical protein
MNTRDRVRASTAGAAGSRTATPWKGRCARTVRRPEPCGRCGRVRQVVVRDPSGSAVCNRCYLRGRKTVCAGCGQFRAVASRGSSLCRSCRPSGPAEPCGTCGALGVQAVRDRDGRRMCRRCWADQALVCVRCGVAGHAAVRIVAGPICRRCLDAVLAHRVQCSDCGILRPNVTDDQRPLCPPCAGLRFKFECPACRRFARPTTRSGVCLDCHLADRHTRRVERFRVPPPTLADYHRRAGELTDSTPDTWRLPFKRYARWAVTGPLLRRVDAGAEITSSLLRWPLRRLQIAHRFATASAAAALAPADVTQGHLDGWLVEFPHHRAELRSFVKWCSHHHYLRGDLTIDAAVTRETRHTLPDLQRLELLQRLLAGGGDDRIARLAGILVLAFGQPLTRTARLPTEAVQVTGRAVEIRLTGSTIQLLEPLAQLAVDVATAARDIGSPWLFPSSQGGRHLTPERLAERLRALDIHGPLRARNAARARLAQQMPAALVAELLGISNTAADRWAKAVGVARGTYVGLLQ